MAWSLYRLPATVIVYSPDQPPGSHLAQIVRERALCHLIIAEKRLFHYPQAEVLLEVDSIYPQQTTWIVFRDFDFGRETGFFFYVLAR
jgi:hypothetical protein